MASTARLDELKKKFDENPRRYFAPLANEHRKSGDLDQAIALCRTHLPQQPAHISGHIVLAQALFEAGSLDEAREIFHTALGLDPENLIALRYLGDIARESSDIATARQWYQRVLEVDPRNDEIEQLVRDLDAPPSVETVDSSTEAPAPEPERAAPIAAAPPPSTPAPADNERFAPLSIDQMDLDPIDTSSLPEGDSAGASRDQGSFDVHASMGDAPTVELPALDVDEIDPFDLNPAASAEALYDPNTAAPAEDFFLNELSEPTGSAPPVDEEQLADADTWFPPAPAAPVVAEAPAEPAPASFEEGDFYLEPPPGAPTEVQANTESTVEAAQQGEDLWAVPNAPAAPVPESVADLEAGFEAVAEVGDSTEAAAEPRAADAMAEMAESPTAEWHAPSVPTAPAQSAPSNDLGLEVMEFVPPTADTTFTSAPAASADADPMIGRTPELQPVDQGTTPASFVTETMAELYLQQGFRNEALAVYRELLARNPADANLRERIEKIENGSMSSIGMATLSEGVVESARKRQTAKPARSVRSFFASLAGRRAPASESRQADASASNEYAYEQQEEFSTESHSAEPVEAASASAQDQPWPDTTPESGRINPIMSAAETLATYDPFADTGDMSSDPSASPISESATPTDPVLFAPNASPEPPAPNADPVAPPTAESTGATEAPARRSLEDLFPDTPIAERTEAAAQTLATAFGRPEPAGRPTRAASSELSLDNVFRGAPENAPPADGGFSFDQFFSDARPAGNDVAATVSPPETGRSGGAPGGDAHDIEQFTAWLEGLKKK